MLDELVFGGRRVKGAGDLCFKTPSHRGDFQAPRSTTEAGHRFLCSPRALVGSTEVGSKRILLGALGARCGAWRSDPGACGVVGVPLPQRPAKFFTERIHGYTGSEPTQGGQRWWKRRRGRGSGSSGMVARMMGMTMIDSAMPDGGSSCDLVSPESGPNRAQGQSIGLRSRDGEICRPRIESGAEYWPIYGDC